MTGRAGRSGHSPARGGRKGHNGQQRRKGQGHNGQQRQKAQQRQKNQQRRRAQQLQRDEAQHQRDRALNRRDGKPGASRRNRSVRTGTGRDRSAPGSSGRGGRIGLRHLRWAGAGLVDQATIALANAGNTLLLVSLLSRDGAAAPILAIAVTYFVIGVNRALVGEVFAALASRYDGEARDGLVRHGLATSVLFGSVVGAGFAGIWAFWPHHTWVDLRDLIWLAPFVPMLLLQDAGRYSHLAERRPDRALMIDLVWVGTQAAVVIGSLLAFGPSAAWILAAWGLGAVASVAVFLVRARPAFWRGSPRVWVAQTRQLSGWFTATALVGQTQTLAVNFLVTGQLSKAALTGLRTAQMALLQPVQNFQLAVQGLLVPRLSRLADDAERAAAGGVAILADAPAVAVFRRRVSLIAFTFAGLAVVVVAVLWPTASLALSHIRKFSDIAPLALPISLQAGIYLAQVPITAALRAMHRARLLFGQYVAFTATSLTGLVTGAYCGGLPGATWGLVTGSATGFVVMLGCYRYAVARLGRETPNRAGDRKAANRGSDSKAANREGDSEAPSRDGDESAPVTGPGS